MTNKYIVLLLIIASTITYGEIVLGGKYDNNGKSKHESGYENTAKENHEGKSHAGGKGKGPSGDHNNDGHPDNGKGHGKGGQGSEPDSDSGDPVGGGNDNNSSGGGGGSSSGGSSIGDRNGDEPMGEGMRDCLRPFPMSC